MDQVAVCAVCASENPAGQPFCGHCGSPLTRTCHACGSPVPPDLTFCGSCGARVQTVPPAPSPPPPRPTEERKVVSVLFADLVGFTARSDRADPEDIRAALRPYHATVREVIESFGGLVEKFIGDAVVGVFGVPTAHEDDPERAVRAALGAITAIERLNRDHPGLDLSVRIAVNTGEAIVNTTPRPERGEGFATGDVMNTASRLQSVAPEGGVVVGEVTYRATRNAVDYDPMTPVQVKGKSGVVAMWLARRPRAAMPGDLDRRHDLALVGRSHELELLLGIWRQVVDESRPHLATIMGPPGIGKSRLLKELTAQVGAGGSVWQLKGRCRPYGETTGYGAFGHQINQVAGILESDDATTARSKLQTAVASLMGPDEAVEVAEHLAVLLGQETATAPDKMVLFYSARRFVESVASQRPTVLVFEDVHWAQPSLLELIEWLAGRILDQPLLLVGLARRDLLDIRPAWGAGLPRFTTISLEPLGDVEAKELALKHLASSDAADEAVRRLVQVGGGNPLFIEELAASLSERAAGVSEGLPTNVQAIIAARLDALPPAERQLLQDASVIGRTFWRGPLAAVRGEENLNGLLDSLEARDFLRRQPTSQVAGDQEYLFKHILIREVAYGTLPRASRRARHATVARYLEATARDRVRESASILAHHWQEAGEPPRAAEYLVMAAEVASVAWAKAQAVSLYTDAIALLDPEREQERIDRIALARAWARLDAGQMAVAIQEDLEPLIERAQGEVLARALLGRARAAYWLADAEAVHTYGQRARTAAEGLGSVDAQVRALSVLGEWAGMDGDPARGVELFTRAIGDWPPQRRDAEYAYTLTSMSQHLIWVGDYARAVDVASDAFDRGMEVGSVHAVINGGGQGALALAGVGRHREALEWAERAVRMGRDIEPTSRFTSRAMNMWAGTLREIHALNEARKLGEEALDLAGGAAFPGGMVSAQIDLLCLDVLEGDLARAEGAIPGLLEEVERTKGWHQWLWAGRLAQARADLALAAGHPDEAAAHARRSLELAQRHGRSKYASWARTSLGQALVALGLPEQAEAEFRAAIRWAEATGHGPSLWPAERGLAAALSVVGRDEESAAVTTLTLRQIEDFAMTLSEAHRTQFLAGAAPPP